jgi:hypothetical protein
MMLIQYLLIFGGVATMLLLALTTCPVRQDDPFGC